MSDHMGAKAISLVESGGIVEDFTARVFRATGSMGDRYTVVIGPPAAVCTCPAGQRDIGCYHTRAALLKAMRDD